MRAVVCRELTGPEGLVLEEAADPPCGANKVRLSVKASGLNYVDALFTQGRYQLRPPLPFVPGSEVAGVISEVGSTVQGWSIGDRVSASIGLGGFASQAVVNADQLLPVPERMTMGQAATMIQSYATIWYALKQRTQVDGGEWVLVLGAAGGVGLAAIDIAKSLGSRVIAAASNDDKLAICADRGADATINYSTEDLKIRTRELTGSGADVVIDPVGGSLSEQALRSLGTDGRLLVIGFASGEIPALPSNQILLRNRRVIGVDWGAWAMANPQANREMIGEILDEVVEGNLHPIEPLSFPLEEAGSALRAMLDRRLTGKACLIP